jgi:hypothetical protein
MECEFCKNKFSSKTNLNSHQIKSRYCLKLRGVYQQMNENKCEACSSTFTGKYELNRHLTTCKKNDMLKKYEEENRLLKEENNLLQRENEMLRTDKKELQTSYEKLSLTVVKRPTTNTKNIQINNFIQQMEPLRIEDIKELVPMLTLYHHVKGPEGYAEYALEFPFKNKIVCLDVHRNKIKYKNEEGDVIEDIGFRKMMTKLCKSLKDHSFNLCQQHYEKLSDEFTDSEMDEYNCMETAMAITKYASGRESDFCNKVIKLISKGSKR